MRGAISERGGNASLAEENLSSEGRVSIARWDPKGMRRSTGPYSMGATSTMNRSAKGGARSSLHYWGEGVSFTHRTKVFADGTVRKNNV